MGVIHGTGGVLQAEEPNNLPCCCAIGAGTLAQACIYAAVPACPSGLTHMGETTVMRQVQ